MCYSHNWCLTDGMKWVIIGAIIAFVFAVFFAICASKTPQGKSDFDQAKEMCGSKGVAHFSYDYHAADETEQPDVTCK